MNKLLESFLCICALGALVLGCLTGRAQTPPLPITPTGYVQLGWDWPTNLLAPFTITNSDPRASEATQIITNATVFYLYSSVDLTNWTPIASATNTTTTTVKVQPSAQFLTVTASNFWGETVFSGVLWLPPLPAPGANLTAKRL